MSGSSDTTSGTTAPHKAGAFDIRNIIGALLGIYGVILTLAGLLGEHEPEKTGGVNANLWTGVALLLVGGFFIAWARIRPIVVPAHFDRPDDDPTRPAPQRKRPPAH
jgi:drug/metabolite transporter (DMT)-like permease